MFIDSTQFLIPDASPNVARRSSSKMCSLFTLKDTKRFFQYLLFKAD